MPFEIDHLLIVATPGAPEAEALLALGLLEGAPNAHPGQGTANRRFFFHNAMLELIYVVDEAEARGPLVAPTRLWQRAQWRATAACPFGLCLRATDDAAPPFPTVDYRPPYLPEGVAIPIARGTPAIEPLLFVNPLGRRPDAARELTGMRRLIRLRAALRPAGRGPAARADQLGPGRGSSVGCRRQLRGAPARPIYGQSCRSRFTLCR